MQKLYIYIPRSSASTVLGDLAKGTAIVSTGVMFPDSGRVKCYYEGNIYGAVNLQTFQDRAICAAGRLITRYPTTAIAYLTPDQLFKVGEMECNDNGSVSSLTIYNKNLEAVNDWLPGNETLSAESL